MVLVHAFEVTLSFTRFYYANPTICSNEQNICENGFIDPTWFPFCRQKVNAFTDSTLCMYVVIDNEL